MFHPFYVKNVKNENGTGEWKAASNLKAGDELLSEDGKKVKVSEVKVEKLAEEITVYNLELDEVHTYYVAGGVLVHNGCGKSNSGSNTRTLFRGDRASAVPDDVFQNGFKPKGTHNDALLHTKSNTTAGNFVSTSGDKTIATEFAGKNGYVYVIQTDNYVDINSTYGAGAYFPEQMEFSIPGGIKPSEIVGAYKKQGGKIIGDFIPNSNFGGN